jgi:hypothetical protein
MDALCECLLKSAHFAVVFEKPCRQPLCQVGPILLGDSRADQGDHSPPPSRRRHDHCTPSPDLGRVRRRISHGHIPAAPLKPWFEISLMT